MTTSWKDRLFTPVQVVLTLGLFVEAAVILGIAATPAVLLWGAAAERAPASGIPRAAVLALAGAAGYFVFGLALLAVIPLVRWVTFARGTPVGRSRTSRSARGAGRATTRSRSCSGSRS